MGIVNRTLDESEQQESLKANVSTVVNGNARHVAIIERACTIEKVRATCSGISGSPTAQIRVTRFGSASFLVGMSFLVPAIGTSGAMAALSLPAAGSTSLNLQKDDLVEVIFGGGTGAAFDHGTVDIVVQNIQDIKTWY
jgi:hypothetical protein